MSGTLSAEWHRDGHFLYLTIEKDRLNVAFALCPFGKSKDSPCWHRQAPCVVEHYVNLYGLDCNVGVAPAKANLEIAWALLGDDTDLDLAQLWWIPVDDEAFASFLEFNDA